MVGPAGRPTCTVYADLTLTRSKVKVKVTGLLNFRQLAKPCMLAAMTAAPLRGFLVLHVTRDCGSVSSDNNAICYVLLVLWMISLCLPIHSKGQAIMFYSCDLLFFAVQFSRPKNAASRDLCQDVGMCKFEVALSVSPAFCGTRIAIFCQYRHFQAL